MAQHGENLWVEMSEPDSMGAWSERGDIVWLPRSLYPKRSDAIRWAMDEWGCAFTQVRCRSRFMKWIGGVLYSGADWWTECERDDFGAFPVWRMEAARVAREWGTARACGLT